MNQLEATSNTKEQNIDIEQRLAAAEALNKKLARELRIVEKSRDIIKVNAETQYNLTENIAREKQKQEFYVKLLLRSHPDIIFVFDENANFLLGTDSICNILDINDISVLRGQKLSSILKRYDTSAITQEMLDILNHFLDSDKLQNNSSVEEKFELQIDNDNYEVKILSFNNDYGKYAGFLVVMHDVTELVRAKDNAEQASRSKSEFLSRMSHEMRTPMNAIVGMTNIAKRAQTEEKRADCLEKIEGASKHLIDVINNVLDMSKIEANKFVITPVAFEFNKMINDAANVLGFRSDEKKQKLIIDIDEKIPKFVISDEFRITQIITNLLANAVKFTPEEGTITLRASCSDEENDRFTIRFEVEDTGIGISDDLKNRVFEAFEQADGGTARKYGGTGLGLAICKQITEKMNGSIWVESNEGEGAKFVFTMPMQKCENFSGGGALNTIKTKERIFGKDIYENL